MKQNVSIEQSGLLMVGELESLNKTEKNGRVSYYLNLNLGGWVRESVFCTESFVRDSGLVVKQSGDTVMVWVRPSVYNGRTTYNAIAAQLELMPAKAAA